MKPNELRIGNLILDINDNICIVSSIQDDFITAKYLGIGSTLGGLENFKPILITEEWLLRLGFRKAKEKLYFLHVPNLAMEIHSVLYRDTWLIELANDRKNIVTEVLQVHQLQNLYYALTCEELTIKP